MAENIEEVQAEEGNIENRESDEANETLQEDSTATLSLCRTMDTSDHTSAFQEQSECRTKPWGSKKIVPASASNGYFSHISSLSSPNSSSNDVPPEPNGYDPKSNDGNGRYKWSDVDNTTRGGYRGRARGRGRRG
ncbi:unnamed protein product [Arabis nemorensis]|uniref:Uncharacterized protein n=1 Tax=Arabis nemorensis TaxID=586526 RepID=A0A565C0J4_9BRAS|nr:unnamed protein product [Arabis nemorensis]